jgi:hypothetical protein
VSIDRAAIEELARLALRPALSILMPSHQAGPEIRQDPIRLKNLLRAVERQLDARGFSPAEIDHLTAPAQALIEDRAFWRHQDEGLAVFAAPNFFRAHRVARRLREVAVVSDRFHVVQLFPIVSVDTRFYVLALSQKDVRLVEAGPTSATAVDLGDLPRSVPDALLTEPPGQELQHHVATVAGGGRGAMFHGHGVGAMDHRKHAIREFFNVLDRGLRSHLSDRSAPLVLAAVEYLVPLYRETSSHPRLLEEVIAGNPESLSTQALHARGWEIVRRHLAGAEEAACRRYHELAGVGRGSAEVTAVLRAAHDGRVDELFVAGDAERWGAFEAASGLVRFEQGPGAASEDLLNLAAVLAFQRGAAIHVMGRGAVPGGGEIAAIFRY